ncbi:RNA polymerase sigma factor [Nonomuraea antimicrobica]
MHDPSSNPSLRVAAEADDASVIANSCRDPEWFSVIFDRYFTAIHRYAAARLGPAAADDVAAETFLAGFDQRGRYDLTRPEAKAWLYGIATNLIGRHRRNELRLYRALSRSAARDDVESHADRVTDRVTAEQLSPRLALGLKACPRATGTR